MRIKVLAIVSYIVFLLSACSQTPTMTFKQDLDILKRHYQPIILSNGDSKLAILGELQGRVMSSTAQGDDAEPIGWFNREAIAKSNKHENNAVLGGADRLWFGPEAGPFGIFVAPENPLTTDYIHVPDAMSSQPYKLVSSDDTQAIFKQRSSILNHSKATLTFDIERTITLLSKDDIEQSLSLSLDKSISVVAYSAKATMTNRSEHDWHYETGVLSLWNLGAFAPSDRNVAIIPTRKPLKEVTFYFSDIADSHTRIKGNNVFYLADGHYMNKIGIPPGYTLPFMGSYDPERNLLTVIYFNFSSDYEGQYVNYVWGQPDKPYGGDVTHIFNDGDYFGPFFELESSSSAKALKVGESQKHFHNTYHFIGEPSALDKITMALFNVTTEQMTLVFKD